MQSNLVRKGLIVAIIVLFVGGIFTSAGDVIIQSEEKHSLGLNGGLIGYWKLDEGSGNIAYDSSGQNNNGTVSGAKWIGGINGTALYIDGIDDYVDCGPTLTGTVLSEVTVEAWVYPKNAGYIFYDGSDGEFSLVRVENGTARFWVKLSDGYPGYYLYSNSILETNVWHHIAGIYNYSADVTKIFVNGQLENTKTIPHLSLYNPPGDYYPTIGAYSSSTNAHWYQFNGTIDEVRVYNRTLTGGEILEHYEEYFPIATVYVDDDFNESTPGWGYDHFDSIQDGVDAVNESGTVYVYNGTYNESWLFPECSYIYIDKSINLIGENKDTTIVNCPDSGQSGGQFGILIGWGHIPVVVRDFFISGFTFKGGDDSESIGIYVHRDSNNIRIEDCIVHNFADGMQFVAGSRNITIKNCTTSNNSRRGGISFAWDDVSNFEISGCTSYSNAYGIQIQGGTNGIIYHNNLYNNTINAYDDNTNTWYSSTLGEGNYYDDYNGTDSDGDGIGNTPYNISGGSNQDLYPLMHPFELYFILDIILENSEVDEGTDFKVIIKSEGGTIIPNAIVEFNDELKTTALTGTVHFTAPQVRADTTYDINANREGYTGDTETILVKDVPFEFVSTFIFGRIDNLTTGGDVITFEAVNIRVITLKIPPSYIPYTSGELLTISKDYFGLVGARFIFAFCGLTYQHSTSTISMNKFSQDDFANTVIWLVSGVEGNPVETKDVEMILLNESGQPQPDAEITFNEVNVEGYINPGDTFTVVAPSDGYYVFMLTHKSSGATIYKSSLTHY